MQKVKSLKSAKQKTQGLPIRRIRRRKKRTDEAITIHPLLQLQKTIGNQAVGKIIQAKLKVGQPGDKYEQEADHVADTVMQMPGPHVQRQTEEEEEVQARPLEEKEELQRQAEEEEELQRQPVEEEEEELQTKPLLQRQPAENEEEEETLQGKENSTRSSVVTPKVQTNINAMRGGGKPLQKSARTFFKSRFGYDFNQVRVHNDTKATETAQDLKAKAFTTGENVVFGAGQYSPETTAGKKLLAHELTHVVQQGAAKETLNDSRIPRPSLQSRNLSKSTLHGEQTIQRDLALEPPAPNAQGNLTDEQVRDAIGFNNRRYRPDVIRLIQDVVGAGVSGTMDEDTVRLIALIQAQFNLGDVDGKVGPDTFDLLVRELSAESAPPDTCMTMFRIRGPRTPMALRVAGPGLANIFSRFDVEARFSPRCNCSDFEYRQFICGTVNRTRAGVVTNLNHMFTIPGGGLPACPGWVQDGNTAQAQNGRYGHRNHAPRVSNRYLDDGGNVVMNNGCLFQAFDFPGLWRIPDVSGDQYDFDMRFFGDIRRGGRRIERKFWPLRDTVTIP
jgi:hypothetical protein